MSGSLRDLDHRHLWHPYTDARPNASAPFLNIVRAEGVYLYEESGRRLLDGISSWWSVALGHGQPRIVAAIQEQAAKLQHAILGTLTHAPAIELATRLAALLPGDLNRIYFASDGSSAVEAALKMAVQYWRNRDRPEKTRFVSIEGAYHGDTIGAMGVGLISWFEETYLGIVSRAAQAPSPHLPRKATEGEQLAFALKSVEGLREVIEKEGPQCIAAIIVEPLCQGASGIRIYPPEYLRGVRELCDEYQVLLIADEIATGFGRTGTMFACEQAGIVPDMMCLGKALTGGYLPMSAVAATDALYASFSAPESKSPVFWDGHTFCGNPITAAAALAALEVFEERSIPDSCKAGAAILAEGFAVLGALPCVAYHRCLGMIGMCAFTEAAGGAALAREVCRRALEQGLFIRPLGEVLYLWPPLTSTEEELGEMLAMLRQAVLDSMNT